MWTKLNVDILPRHFFIDAKMLHVVCRQQFLAQSTAAKIRD